MQVTELFRRGVVRPLDKSGAAQLREYWISTSIRVEWLPVLGEAQFGAIWDAGILQALNKACGVRLSDYEEAIIEPCQIDIAIGTLKAMKPPSDDEARYFFEELQKLLLAAKKNEMPVMFVF